MSKKALGAENQQATQKSVELDWGASETTRQTPFTKMEILAYLQGAIHDSSLNKKKRIRFAQKNRDWLEKIKFLLEEIGYKSWIYEKGKDRNIFVLETLCKELDFHFNASVLKFRNEKIFYIRGFFDAEGGIPRNGKKFYVQMVQKNIRKLERLKTFLSGLGIKAGKIHNPSKNVDSNYWRFFVSTESHYMFAKIIGSYHPVKLRIFRERMKI